MNTKIKENNIIKYILGLVIILGLLFVVGFNSAKAQDSYLLVIQESPAKKGFTESLPSSFFSSDKTYFDCEASNNPNNPSVFQLGDFSLTFCLSIPQDEHPFDGAWLVLRSEWDTASSSWLIEDKLYPSMAGSSNGFLGTIGTSADKLGKFRMDAYVFDNSNYAHITNNFDPNDFLIGQSVTSVLANLDDGAGGILGPRGTTYYRVVVGPFPVQPVLLSPADIAAAGGKASEFLSKFADIPTRLSIGAGSMGVTYLQQTLAWIGTSVGIADGAFGPGTKNAWNQFLSWVGLPQTGAVATNGHAAMGDTLALIDNAFDALADSQFSVTSVWMTWANGGTMYYDFDATRRWIPAAVETPVGFVD